MILSYLQTKHLTRVLTVSKYWQQSILGSRILRRQLFLEAALATEHLDYVQGRDGERIPCILRKPSKSSIPILEPHPVFLSGGARFETITEKDIWIGQVPCESVRIIQPSTFLFQPPVAGVFITYFTREPDAFSGGHLQCRGGATFGALQEELEAKRKIHLQWLAKKATTCSDRLEDVKEEEFNIIVVGAIGTSVDLVKQARDAS